MKRKLLTLTLLIATSLIASENKDGNKSATLNQANDSFAKYYNPPIEKFVKNCDYDKAGGINSNPEIACFEALEKQYDENFDKRMDERIAGNQDKIAEQDKKIAEQTAKIMELQFKIKDNNRKIAKLRVANKNNTGTYEENLAEIARLEENIRNMDRLIKGMQEFAK